ncbi:hypothetical protein [Micromonospora sp. RTGN7]|uniref:hypothetical protein n=1 Tax=Micromonospora sp. RTGN7 TaxID=3016526 RepID=UPI0029FF0EDF|nr:hypothetical protein [Micromonospora sp. RTGN7]
MTAGGFREVDHDLLADYLGGALDGTPDEAVVARLVEQNPAWAEAHDALAPALARVGEDLATWADLAAEMPLAVADRIAAALAGAGPGTATDPSESVLATHSSGPVGRVDEARPVDGGLPALVPSQSSAGSRRPAGGSRPTTGPTGVGPGRRGRRWVRIAGPVALATASVFAVGLGLNQLVGGTSQSDSGVHTTMGEHTVPGAAVNGSFREIGTPRRSGIDWTPEALAAEGAAPRTGPGKSLDRGSTGPVAADESRLPALGGLKLLTSPNGLNSCLAAVSAEHGVGLLTVDLVDYARFRGAPALVLRFVDPSGARWAWVSGPECGVPGSGADTRYRARVG